MIKRFSFTLCLLALTTLYGFAAPRPNIILLMADDMGWGDPSYNSTNVTYADGSPHPDQGWINTPVMDDMAASGLRFDRFYAASAVCSPTRYSCLTGRNPVRGGIATANTGRLEFDETPLSEILSAEGYATAHMGKWHLGILTTERLDGNDGGLPENFGRYSGPWHHGYDTVFATESKVPTYNPYGNFDYDGEMDFTNPNVYNDHGTRYWKLPYSGDQTSGEGTVIIPDALHTIATNYETQPYDGDDSQILVNRAIPFMQDAVSNNQPFFLVLWFHTPHKPVKDRDNPGGSANTQAGLKNSIQDMDTAIGRLRTELTTLGVRSNTMFWVTSDNGPENGIDAPADDTTAEKQRPLRSGRYLDRKGSLYEGGIIVPGILEWPDVITTGSSTDMPVVTTDYYPTILDYLQLTVPNQKPLDGISLRPVIEGTSSTRGKPIGFKLGGDEAYTSDQYKLIKQDINGQAVNEWEVFDMVNIAAGEEPEQTPLITQSNYDSKSQLLKDLYDNLQTERGDWKNAIDSDTAYVHSSQPTVTLSTPSNSVSAPFMVTATFSKSVSQLHANEFAVSNGTPSGLSGSGTTWTVLITPNSTGSITVNLPAGAVIDANGNINPSASPLNITYVNASAPDVSLTTSTNAVTTNFTVTATFSEEVSGLEAADFDVTNGSAANLAGGPAAYTVTIEPATPGTVSLFLPGGVAQDGAANGNNSSAVLNVTYDPPMAPSVVLSGPGTVSGAYTVTITFSEAVTGLTAGDFTVANGTADNLTGSGADYTLQITPDGMGNITVSLPAGSATDLDDGLDNTAATPLTTVYAPIGGGGTIVETNLPPASGQTVDSAGLVPGHGSNNIEKFTEGPYHATNLFVRGGSAARQVRAFTRFDLSATGGQPVTQATLRFNGYSLNSKGNNDVDIEVIALAADWSESGSPLPTFSHATTGSTVNGGSVVTDLDGDLAKDYSFDLTEAVRNWANGTWTNHGVRIQLSSHAINNGVGIKTSGESAIELLIGTAPLTIDDSQIGPGSEDFTIQWNSAAGLLYGIEATSSLTNSWDVITNIPGSVTGTNSYTFFGDIPGFTNRFYRVVYPANSP